MTLDQRKKQFLADSKANVEKQRFIQSELQRLYNEMIPVMEEDERLEAEFYAIQQLQIGELK